MWRHTVTHERGSEGGNWRMEWVASTLHTTSEHDISSITTIITADAHTSAASSRLNWRPRRFKWTRSFRRKRKYGFCACAITFQTQSTIRGFNPTRTYIFFSSKRSDRLWGPLSLLFSGCRELFTPGVNRPGRAASYLQPFTVKVGNW